MGSVRPSRPADHDAIRTLLRESSLPISDLGDAKLETFLVATDAAGVVVGCGGLEVCEDHALLRSLAATVAVRGRGIGSRLVERLERWAVDLDVAELWLLTETAAEFFSERGYTRADRAAAPEAIRSTSEFRSLCPDTAACLNKKIVKGRL